MSRLLRRDLLVAARRPQPSFLAPPRISPRGDSRAPQTIYVQGYGAIFLVHVNFPLEGRPEAPKASEEKPTNSEWESVKEQLYGSPGAAEPVMGRPGGYAQAPEYSAERVEGVQDDLIRSLKNASNICGLAPDEVVVVSVQGPAGAAYSFTGVASVGGGGIGSSAGAGTAPAGMGSLGAGVGSWSVMETKTFLSLRVKKSDIDAFAAGGLKFDDFKSKVVKAVYHSAARREAGPGPWSNYNSYAPAAR